MKYDELIKSIKEAHWVIDKTYEKEDPIPKETEELEVLRRITHDLYRLLGRVLEG